SPSGLGEVQLWAKAPNELGYSEIASYTAPLAHGSFSYAALAGDGTYSFYTVAVDKAGNAEDAAATADTTTLLHTAAPASGASAPQYSTSRTIDVSYTAFDPGAAASGLKSVELWVETPGAGAYSKVATSTSGSFTYTAAGDGNYGSYTVAVAHAGDA